MRDAAERVLLRQRGNSKEAYGLELDWTKVALLSHLKRTAPGFIL